jgi:hypothetical protein
VIVRCSPLASPRPKPVMLKITGPAPLCTSTIAEKRAIMDQLLENILAQPGNQTKLHLLMRLGRTAIIASRIN